MLLLSSMFFNCQQKQHYERYLVSPEIHELYIKTYKKGEGLFLVLGIESVC